MSVVSLKNVFKSYPLGKERIEAVKGVSFDIEKGEFAAISGPSGSGKSTILNMIGLIDLPSAGSIVIGGTDVYDGVNLEDAEVLNTRWVSSGDNKKKKTFWCHKNFSISNLLHTFAETKDKRIPWLCFGILLVFYPL